jgi:hypothetical protein
VSALQKENGFLTDTVYLVPLQELAMQYPNKIQSCILLRDRFGDLETIVDNVRHLFESQAGINFSIPEERPGYFYHLFGQHGDLMITFEYIDDKADTSCFDQALNSPVTEIYEPGIRQRVAMHRSCIIVTIWHGVLGGVEDDPKIASMLESLGRPRDGATIAQFNNRLSALRLISHVACDQAPASAIHWAQSNQLFSAEMFIDLARKSAGMAISLHPYLYGYQADAQGRHELGVKSFGAEHFLGREIFIKPNTIPWHANYGVINMFVEMALARDGAVTADHFIMAPEDKSFGYLCIHHDQPAEGEAPEYELVPMWYKEYDFITDDPEQQPFLNSIGIGIENNRPVANPSPPTRPMHHIIRPGGFGRKQV